MSTDPFSEGTEEQDGGVATTSFFEGGSPACQFKNIGDVHVGTIEKFEEAQQRDITSGELAFWPDGNKKEMLVITIQTEERSQEIDDDDGTRRLYVNKPSGMYAAIAQAIKASKARFAVGGTIAVKFTKLGIPKTKGFNAPKEYVAKYTPPNGTATASPAPAADSPDAIMFARGECVKEFVKKTPGHDKAWWQAAFNVARSAKFAKPETSMTVDDWDSMTVALINDYDGANAQWRKKSAGPSQAPPFGDEVQFKDDDIPFRWSGRQQQPI